MHARVFVRTRHTSALCYLCVCSPCPPPWLFLCSNQRNSAVGDVARHGNILAFLVAVCGLPTIRLHAAAYLLSPLLPFASYISGRAGGRWARLGYASWSPFTFVGVVAVLVSCPLPSVAWHATYLVPTSHVCMFSFFFFFFFLCCALPRRSFCSPLFVPSYHVARPWR